MKKCLTLAVGAALFTAWAGLCSAQSDAPYTEGGVWQITMVKTKYGMSDDYLKGLAKTFKGTLEEAKKQDLILDYKILIGDAATPQDFDILLMVESKNMAALDNAREKFDPIAKKIEGNVDQQRATATKRLDIREIMGGKLMREITLKYSGLIVLRAAIPFAARFSLRLKHVNAVVRALLTVTRCRTRLLGLRHATPAPFVLWSMSRLGSPFHSAAAVDLVFR
jgi:hypothetical protein